MAETIPSPEYSDKEKFDLAKEDIPTPVKPDSGIESYTKEALVPRTREEIRAEITKRRGYPPTDEELKYIVEAAKKGDWLS